MKFGWRVIDNHCEQSGQTVSSELQPQNRLPGVVIITASGADQECLTQYIVAGKAGSIMGGIGRRKLQRLRLNDAVGRYGGEEFAVILADTDGEMAVKVLNKIREDLSRLRHMADGVEFSATFSCGVADVAVFGDATKLGDAADKALYKAKHGGRNWVYIISEQ